MKRYDLHVHTNFSDGISSIDEVIRKAKENGLNGIAITDHDTVKAISVAKKLAKKHDLEFIPGIEITTQYGDLLALNIEEVVSGEVMEIVDKIHELGGIVAIAHPFIGQFPVMLKDVAKILRVDAIEVYNAMTPLEANIKAFQLAKELKLPGIAGSDAHDAEFVGNAFTICGDDIDIINAIRKNKVKVGWI